MIYASDFRKGRTFQINGEPHVVLDFMHVKPGKGAAFVRTKYKNIITGATREEAFNPDDKFEEAIIETKKMQYLYNDGDLYYFMDQETYEQVPVAYDMENWGTDYRTYNLTKSQITSNTIAFCEVVKAAGYTPMVYYGMGNYQKFDTALLSSRYKIWFAHYTTQTSYTGHYDIWQFTAKARCPGITGDVDKNVMFE